MSFRPELVGYARGLDHRRMNLQPDDTAKALEEMRTAGVEITRSTDL